MKKKFITMFVFCVLSCPLLWAQNKKVEVFDGKTSIKDPFSVRDPFKAPVLKSEKSKKSKERAMGIMNNIEKGNFNYNLESIKIIGVLIGKERRAIVQAGNSDKKSSITYREGESIGDNGPEIKAILPGGVILVEKITNIYGQDEFIETVVPISD